MMILPTVHINGTSREALSAQFAEVLKALQRALEAMADAAPNARDYYPQGESAFRLARAEHESRIACVRAIREDYYRLYESVEKS